MNLTPIFRQADPDDEVVPCFLDDCEALCPLAGPDGIVRHLLAVHPESFVARAIFRRLVEVQLANVEEAGR